MSSTPLYSEETIVGIDLGTSTSAIAVLVGGRPELVQDAQGDRIIPSVVQITPENETVVGSVAKHGAIAFHDRTAQEAKRLMATYADMEELIQLGAYRRGTTPDVDLAIEKNPFFESFLRQGKEEATSLGDCYSRLAEIIGHSGGGV